MSIGPTGDLWRRVTRYVDEAIARQRKVPSPTENYGAWFLTVEDAAGTPVRGIGVERIVFDAGVVSKPQPGVVRVAGGGGGGGHGYTWFVSVNSIFAAPLELRHPVMETTTLTRLKWRAGAGDPDVTISLNGSPVVSQVMAGDSATTVSVPVTEGDTLSAEITAISSYDSLVFTIAP